ARHHGVLESYVDAGGTTRHATPETLRAVLRALGVPIERTRDAAGALREAESEAWSRGLEPTTVAWEGRAARAGLRVPSRLAREPRGGEPRRSRAAPRPRRVARREPRRAPPAAGGVPRRAVRAEPVLAGEPRLLERAPSRRRGDPRRDRLAAVRGAPRVAGGA